MEYLVTSFRESKLEIDSIEIIDLSELVAVQSEISELDTVIKEIESLLKSYSRVHSGILLVDEKIVEIDERLEKFKVCPLCNSPLGK